MEELFLIVFFIFFLPIILWKIRKLESKVEHLTVLSTRDELTGVLNRRGGEEALAHQYSMLARDDSAKNRFAILTLDLNDFKIVNDTYGHDAGDQVLKFVASTLSSVLRDDYDILVRAGGDEFYVIAPGCDLEDAKLVRAKIKAMFKSTPFRTNGTTLSVGVSVGVATSHKNNDQKRYIKTVFNIADRLMYSDKSAEY